MDKRVEKQINKIYKEVFEKIFNDRRLRTLVKTGKTSDIHIAISKLSKSAQYKKFAMEFAKKLATMGLNKEKGLWRKYYEAAKTKHLGVIEKTYSEFEQKQIEKTVKHNFKMITSIPKSVEEVVKQKSVKTLIKEVVHHNIPLGSFQKELAKKGTKHANVVARTETSKLQTFMVESRAKDLGSKAYIWGSTKDRRTRPSHQAMNGVVVFYRKSNDEKPLLDDFHIDAGEGINCRCLMQPIFDETDVPYSSNVKYYNYKTHKIATMIRSKLISCIERGQL